MNEIWKLNGDSKIIYQGKSVYFKEMNKESYPYNNGFSKGIREHYTYQDLSFETLSYKEDCSNDQYYEFHPIYMEGVEEVDYPDSIIMDEDTNQDYTVLNLNQGLLIPNNYPVDLDHVHFNGQMNSSAAYMPWFGHVRKNKAIIGIAVTNDDMAYSIHHSSINHSTRVQFRTLPSLGKLQPSISRFSVVDGDYNDLCKVYKEYAKEKGLYKTLREKEIDHPLVKDLIQCSFVHKGIKKHISKDSMFYDHEDLQNNDLCVSFAYRTKEIEHFHELGAKKIYFHIDGWGEPGYDNQHPDYLPVCIEAGGEEGLKDLISSLHKHGDLVGLHDQYRDYYFDAKSFDPYYALMTKDHHIFEMTRWAGGHQSYLCASFAENYVKRNFNYLFHHGIFPDCSYLDVFTCNEMDECYHPMHRMTRKQCKEYRMGCLQYVYSKGILTSSEEMNDWAVPSLVFCHYAPYEFMLSDPSKPKLGIPVPLFNMVYHECVIIPWPMDEGKEDYMLYALINGGVPYLDKDGAYPNVDGVFDEKYNNDLKHKIHRADIVSNFYQKVAYASILKHEILSPDKQRTTFDNGIAIEVDFKENTYQIIE